MFEETTLYKTTQYKAQNSSETAQKLSVFDSTPCWNERHQCWCRLWLATGYIKPIQKEPLMETPPLKRWYLYCEYQDKNGNSGYVQKAFSSLNAALAFAEQHAPTLQLPNCSTTRKMMTG